MTSAKDLEKANTELEKAKNSGIIKFCIIVDNKEGTIETDVQGTTADLLTCVSIGVDQLAKRLKVSPTELLTRLLVSTIIVETDEDTSENSFDDTSKGEA